MRRLLVTGSRAWDDVAFVRMEIINAVNFLSPPVTLIHGNCPIGADSIADDIFEIEYSGWPIERYPADWNTYGKRAGFIRNSEMVNLGADLCLAFIKNQSRGATMTADLAEKAGIPTWRYLK